MNRDTDKKDDKDRSPAKNIFHSADYATEGEAKGAYLRARERMLDVNHWYRYAGVLSSSFQLTDEQGGDLDRSARQGDYVKIDVPGPGSGKGGGYDWVEITVIDDQTGQTEHTDRCLMTAQPSPNPAEPEKGTAHFLDAGASNTVVVKREDRTVIAVVETRKEKVHKVPDKPLENIRNYVMASAGILGVSNMQWESLAKGLIEGEEE
jgi:hypothetical protein